MRTANNAERTRRELLIRITKGFLRGTLKDTIDRIPVDMRPREQGSTRCCVYKDRAVLKYRIMALLGFGIEDETDEARPLSDYLRDAKARERLDEDILSVLDVACSGCIETQYLVTNACRGCFARPCTLNCPRDAIQVVDGQAKIDHSKCIDCGKCTQVCPYHAIVRVPIPCEEACPVNAIHKNNATGKQYIDFNDCVSCGKCMDACPFGAILERSQIVDVLMALKEEKQVVAMVAPSIIGQFPGHLSQIAEALQKAGFFLMEEVAFGAEMTTEHEAKEFFERIEQGDHIMTSSCCPAYVETVKRHVKDLLPFVSDTPSPMGYTAAEVKKKNPDCVAVFIGPCIAKRKEAQTDENVDYVMTFEELGALFAAMEIDVASLDGIPLEREVEGYARGFATSCGVTSAMLKEAARTKGVDIISEDETKFINGLDRKTVKQLKLYANGKLPGKFLEVMACEGGCVGGPCTLGDVRLAAKAVQKLAEK
jgi:[FeFe] hydrogenase (group B1/B3)